MRKEVTVMINIAIVDDSADDRELLKGALRTCFEGKADNVIISEFADGKELMSGFKKEMYTIIFLDIFMEDMNGIETARKIREYDKEVRIIFTSISSEFAVESYDVAAYGYIVKPVSRDKLDRLIDRYREEADAGAVKYYVAKSGGISRKIYYDDIEYIESRNTTIQFHLRNKIKIHVYGKLGDIERQLNDERFLRCHQSYLINMDHVEMVDDMFHMESGNTAAIRIKNIKQIKDRYFEYIKSKT
jgi:DNA-binding LytR/AlgR family response regulator